MTGITGLSKAFENAVPAIIHFRGQDSRRAQQVPTTSSSKRVHKSRQVWGQFVRQLTFHLKLMPNRRLHLAAARRPVS